MEVIWSTGLNKLYRFSLNAAERKYAEANRASAPDASTVVFIDSTGGDERNVQLLEKILQAVNIGPSAHILVNKADYPSLRLQALRLQFPSLKYVIAFGLPARAFGLNISLPENSVEAVGPFLVLLSEGLQMISSNETSKRNLWAALKSMYAV